MNPARMITLMVALAGSSSAAQDFVTEPSRQVPVLFDADVVVAGAGVTGTIAAIAAARNGAKTVLIERASLVGGTSGPGLNTGGGNQKSGPFEPTAATSFEIAKNIHIYPEITGITKEFKERVSKLRNEGNLAAQKPVEAHMLSYVATKMLKEAGVELLLSTMVTDPIMEGNTVKGVFIENKSGRQAVKAKVVVDATGEADVARRAGAPILHPKESYREIDGHAPNGLGLFAFVSGVDWEKYENAFRTQGKDFEGTLRPYDVDGLAQIVASKSSNWGTLLSDSVGSMASIKVQLVRPHAKVDAGNGLHISKLETAMRIYIFELILDLRKRVPGCENLYLVEIGALGARGGPCIEGEHVMTFDDAKAGRQFPDVVYIYGERRALEINCKDGHCEWADVPYRVMVPKKIDGLLAVGRSASQVPDTLLRNRTAVQHMGQVGGTAAALAAKEGVTPRKLNVKTLQQKLIQDGFYLGDEKRLKALGLSRVDVAQTN